MNMKKNQSNITSEKIGLFEKIAYGGGDLASNLILVLSSTFVTFFYTDALGLNAAIIGMIMMVFLMGQVISLWGLLLIRQDLNMEKQDRGYYG